MLNSGGMGNVLREACWGGGTSVSSLYPEVIQSEQEHYQLEQLHQCSLMIRALDLFLLYHRSSSSDRHKWISLRFDHQGQAGTSFSLAQLNLVKWC